MSLKNWENNGWLKPHHTSKQEIGQLFEIVERDIKDAKQESLSADWKFGIAYNAALKLCTILLYASGYQAEKNLAHYRTLQSLPLILGTEKEDDAVYLDRCRAKRNIVEYDYVGGTTEADADELICFVNELKTDVANWIQREHPELL
jgi:hypothetical protein